MPVTIRPVEIKPIIIRSTKHSRCTEKFGLALIYLQAHGGSNIAYGTNAPVGEIQLNKKSVQMSTVNTCQGRDAA
jgi:hypothetical protein